MLLDDIFDALLLKVLELVLLEVEANLRTTPKRGVFCIRGDGKSTTGSRLPDVLLIVVVLRDDLHALRNEVGRVETDTELTNHRDIGTGAEGLHESLCTRLSDRTKIVDHVGLGHTDTSIADGQSLVFLVRDDTNEKVLARLKDRRVRERLIANLVERIGGVRNQFTQENLLVGVEGV